MKAFLTIPLVILLFAFTVILNRDLIDIRISELNYLLGQAAHVEEAVNTLSIVSKYELIKRRIEHGEGKVANYTFEAKMLALTSEERFSVSTDEKQKNLLPVRLILRGLRFILGKENINPVEDKEIFDLLEIAYYQERNRNYSEAIKKYDQVMLTKKEMRPEIHAVVLLHKAFCHSMLNEYEESKQIFELIINEYPNTEAGILAWKLLDFLRAIEKKREMLKQDELPTFDSGKQCYLLMDYESSIKLFSEFLKQEPDNPNSVEAHYFKGRSHEELGEVEEALEEYNRVIQLDENNRWALESNRRLFMLGRFYEQGEQIALNARHYLSDRQDNGFINNVEEYAGGVSISYIPAHIPEEQREETDKSIPLKMSIEREPAPQVTIEEVIPEVAKADIVDQKEDYLAIEELRFNFSQDLERLNRDLASKILVEDSDIEQGMVLLQEIKTSGYSFPKLKADAETLIEKALKSQKDAHNRRYKIKELASNRETLRAELAGREKRKKRYRLGTWISYGVGISALGGMGIALYLGNDAYNRYKEAIDSDDAIALREETQTYQKIAITTGVIGGIGIAAGTLFWLLKPNPNKIQREIDDIEAQIELLNRQSPHQ